ncbi:Homeobox-leucine zipper protein hdg12 [Thalictrum thalictroides]|uniref:Homeobox-leucine zipper protein hdg12 n=1 Tax=Thalictrum thalictroides TaxID=46969 RepID=A0A7J6XAH2_THATH|nr:Homeobox-leucine zipper protein hdg12 [Thalictrum thalictroides]
MLNAASGGLGGDDPDDFNPWPHQGIPPWPCSFRHTPEQVLEMEEFYEENAYPDKKQQRDLANKIGLKPQQVLYWFQNRRQLERVKGNPPSGPDGRTKRSNAYRDSTNGSLDISEGDSNNQARSSNVGSYNGDQDISTLHMQTTEMPVAREVPLTDAATTATNQQSTQRDTTPMLNRAPYQTRPSDIPSLAELIEKLSVSEINALMVDTAVKSMNEFLELTEINEPLWKSSSDWMGDDLDTETYRNMFPKDNYLNNSNVRIEASRSSGVVMVDESLLANMFMDPNKWMQCFPTVVPEAELIRIEASAGITGNPHGTLQLGLWAVVDISWNPPKVEKTICPIVRKLPSGCLIQGMRNGCTKVTWIEHVEVEDRTPIHPLVRDHILKGVAFGAGRWISTLQRISERLEFSPATGATNDDDQLNGVLSSDTGRENLMKLSQMMINNFFASINTSHSQKWSTLSRSDDIQVRMSHRGTTQPVKSDSLIIGAATSIWLPLPSTEVFDFLRKEKARPQWDVLYFDHAINEIAYIVNGLEPGHRISVLEAVDPKGTKTLILQESSTDPSGSLVVHSPINMDVLNSLTTEQDLSKIELLPSGMAIFPAGGLNSKDGASSSSSSSTGSFVTLGFQKNLGDLRAEKMNLEAINRAKNVVQSNVSRLKSALNNHL